MFERLQRLYDEPQPRYKALRNLWGSVQPVRELLTMAGCSQESLNRSCSALQAKGVIYAVICFVTRRIYVGQTLKSACDRFQEHVRLARRGEGETLHAAMRSMGWNNFMCFPLEHIDVSFLSSIRNPDERVKAFRKIATPRERFWIDRLHSYAPNGFNVVVNKRSGRIRVRVINPMIRHRRRQRKGAVPSMSPEAARQSLEKVRHPIGTDQSGRWYGSRDWERRLRYLSHKASLNQLNTVNWGDYNPKTLSRLLQFMDTGLMALSSNIEEMLRTAIQAALLLRPYWKGRIKNSGKAFIRLEWRTHLLRRLKLRSILGLPEIRRLLPPSAVTYVDTVMVAKKLTKSVGSTVLNYQHVARNLPDLKADTSCPCRRLFPLRFRPEGACVCTGDLSIVKLEALRELLTYGPKFRENCNADPFAAVAIALGDFIERMSATLAIDQSLFNAWKSAVLAVCRKRLPTPLYHTPVLQQEHVRRYLKFLQRYLVFVPVDKAADNYGIICKSLFSEGVRQELEKLATYEVERRRPSQIAADHAKFLKQWGFSKEERLPFLYWTPKFHKDPVGKRFIAASMQCTTTRVSKILADVFRLVLRTLREKDDDRIRRTRVRHFFVVDTFEEVSAFLARWERCSGQGTRKQLYTGDFSTMYTAIPHQDCLNAVTRVVDEALVWHATQANIDVSQVRMCWTKSGVVWSRMSQRGQTKNPYSLSASDVIALTEFLISNTFLVNNSVVRRQAVGLPMGTNCAPVLANLYLYDYENRFMERLSAEHIWTKPNNST